MSIRLLAVACLAVAATGCTTATGNRASEPQATSPVPPLRANAALAASIGLALNSEGQTPEQLLAAADQALYRAKQNGRNRVEEQA